MKIYKSTKGDIVFAKSARLAKEAFTETTGLKKRGKWARYKDAPQGVVDAMERASAYTIAVAGYVYEEAE